MDPGNSIPLASIAHQALSRLAAVSDSAELRALDAMTLLGERAMRAGFLIPGRTSAGGGCRLFDALGDTLALNLARPADREMLPALFENDQLDANDDGAIAACMGRADAHALLMRGRSMGLPMAAEHERRSAPELTPLFDQRGSALWPELATGPAAARGARAISPRSGQGRSRHTCSGSRAPRS